MVNQSSSIVEDESGTYCHQPLSKIGSFRDGGTEGKISLIVTETYLSYV